MGTANVVNAGFDPTSLFAGPYPVRDRLVIVAAGSNAAGVPLPRGTLLGRVTATDKYIPSVKTASDGSQIPVAVLASYPGVDASAADVNTRAYFEGEFAYEMMQVDASWTYATLAAALRQSLADIFVRSVGVLG